MMIDFINRKLFDIYRQVSHTSNWTYEDWLEFKKPLNEILLNGESKVSFDVDVAKSNEEIKDEIDGVIHHLYVKFGLRGDIRAYMSTFIYNCINSASMAETVEKNKLVNKIEGKYSTYQKGMKLTKVFSKEFKSMIGEEMLSDFLKKYSMVIQSARIQDKVYISTLPEDIITMSDNTNDWSSCMSTDSQYLYRMGSVEYMQSPRVAIAYTKSRAELAPGVDNKKWRALIMLNSGYEYKKEKEYMTLNIKRPYPFENPGVLEALGEYLKSNIDMKIVDRAYYSSNVFTRSENFHQAYKDSTYVDLCFELNNEDYKKALQYNLGYTCPFCGHAGTCTCLDDVTLCSSCGEYHHEENVIYVEGYENICEECFDEYFSWCEECGEGTHRDDMIEVAGFELVCEWCADTHYTECRECGEIVRNSEVNNGMCEICEEEEMRKKERETL